MPSDVVIINHAHDVNEPCTSECRTPSGESVITILDEGAVDAILTTVRADGNLVLTLAERDALCATVKHLRWQVDLCEKAFELDTALRLSEVGDLNALQVVRKMVDLQSQLEQLRAGHRESEKQLREWQDKVVSLMDRLAQVEQERDELRTQLNEWESLRDKIDFEKL